MTTLTAQPLRTNRTIVRILNIAFQTTTRTYFHCLSRLHPDGARRQAERLFTTPPRHATRYPVTAAAQRLTVLSEAGHLAVWQAGPEGAPAVLLVHGWGGVGAQLGNFVPPLLARGFRVVWFDLPGHGESDGRQTALPEMVRGLAAIEATCGPFHAAIGHSIGAAAIALAMRSNLSVRRMVLIGAPASITDYMHSFARLLGISGKVREMLRRGIEARYGRRIDDIDRIEDLGRLDIPALLVHDSGDREVPFAHSQRIAAHLRHPHLVRTYGLGHYRILRDRQVVQAVTAFVTDDPVSAPQEIPALPIPAPCY